MHRNRVNVGRLAVVFLALGVAFSPDARSVRADLFRWYKLDEGEGEVAHDLAGHHNGLILNGQWTNDSDRGTVLQFDGEQTWVEGGSLPRMTLENGFTWSFWAYQDPSQETPSADIIVGNRFDAFGANTDPREFIKFTPDRFEFHMDGGVEVVGDRFLNDLRFSDCDACEERSIPGGEWIHHTVVKDADELIYYRNGEYGHEIQIETAQVTPDGLQFALGGQAAPFELPSRNVVWVVERRASVRSRVG